MVFSSFSLLVFRELCRKMARFQFCFQIEACKFWPITKKVENFKRFLIML